MSRQEPEVTELVLYARNVGALHNDMLLIARNHGNTPYLTSRGFMDIAHRAARKYRMEFGNADSTIFSAYHLLLAAAELCEWYTREYGSNES